MLGRTQWSLEPGRPDNWLCFDVSQVQNELRPPWPVLHACLFLSPCRLLRFPLPKWGSHHYCCHYPIGNVAERALPLHPTPPSKRWRKTTHDVRPSLHLILVSGCKFAISSQFLTKPIMRLAFPIPDLWIIPPG